MAQVTVYMNYVIFFNNDADYNAAVAIAGSNLLEMNPRDAGTLFGIPYPYPSGDIDTMPKGIYFLFPFIPGSALNFPSNSGMTVDDTVDSQLVPGQAGSPASIFPAGPDGLHVWSANIIKSAGAGSSIVPPVANISQRRFACGFEFGPGMEANILTPCQSRDASRTIGGMGMSVRGTNTGILNQTINKFRTGLTSGQSWERFYFRLRGVPATSTFTFWRCHGNTNP